MNYDDDEEPKPLVSIMFLTNGGKTVEVPADSNLLRMSLRNEGGMPFKCGGGICGTCRCLIEEGAENTAPPTKKERNHISDDHFAMGFRLACQTTLTGPLKVSWVPLDQRKKLPSGQLDHSTMPAHLTEGEN
jgi:ferredoxin